MVNKILFVRLAKSYQHSNQKFAHQLKWLANFGLEILAIISGKQKYILA